MVTTSAELYGLQEIDLAIDGRQIRLAEITESLGTTGELLEARESVMEGRRRAKALLDQQKESEWEVNEVKEKARSVREKLYGGRIRNAKELQDLQADLNSLQSAARDREERLLGLLLEVEEAGAALGQAEGTLACLEEDWSRAQGQLQKERDEISQEMAGLQKEREEEVSNYDPTALELYDQLRDRRNGRAVAKVEGGLCGGCRISLPSAVVKRARMGLSLAQCVSCERILYVS